MRARSFFAFFLFIAVISAQTLPQTKSIEDNSDWWSLIGSRDNSLWKKEDRIRTPASSLGILGISLLDENFPSTITKKLGPTVDVTRGDASTGRNQFCYGSVGSDPKVHLIFEYGEVDNVFYLFSGGRDWNGSRYCKTTKLVTEKTSTPSGLHLGLTRQEVESILGKPTLVRTNRIIYVRSVSVKSTPEELKRARAASPGMSEKDFLQNYGHYDFSTTIDVRFKDSKLNYLGILQAETY